VEFWIKARKCAAQAWRRAAHLPQSCKFTVDPLEVPIEWPCDDTLAGFQGVPDRQKRRDRASVADMVRAVEELLVALIGNKRDAVVEFKTVRLLRPVEQLVIREHDTARPPPAELPVDRTQRMLEWPLPDHRPDAV